MPTNVLRNVRALLRLRGAGVTLVQIDRATLAEELWSFGEDGLYLEPLSMSDEDMVRVWVAAGKLLMDESARSSGEAGALAAVEVMEGRRRPLARRRRRRQADVPRFDRTPAERYAEIGRIEESDGFPEHWR